MRKVRVLGASLAVIALALGATPVLAQNGSSADVSGNINGNVIEGEYVLDGPPAFVIGFELPSNLLGNLTNFRCPGAQTELHGGPGSSPECFFSSKVAGTRFTIVGNDPWPTSIRLTPFGSYDKATYTSYPPITISAAPVPSAQPTEQAQGPSSGSGTNDNWLWGLLIGLGLLVTLAGFFLPGLGGEDDSVPTGVEQPTLPPGEVFTPPPPPVPVSPDPSPPAAPRAPDPVPQTPRPRTKHCGPQVDKVFVDALNRVVERLRVIFGAVDPAGQATGMVFLAANGKDLDFWVHETGTDADGGPCPSPECVSTVTLCGRCHQHHILSDFMYGFVAGWFGLTEAHVDAGGLAWQLFKALAEKKTENIVPAEHETEARPAYHAGVQLGQKLRDDHLRKVDVGDLCSGTTGEHLGTIALRTECPPCTCVATTSTNDFSRKPWLIDPIHSPEDSLSQWAVTGDPPR
jgi:hypothetical protein